MPITVLRRIERINPNFIRTIDITSIDNSYAQHRDLAYSRMGDLYSYYESALSNTESFMKKLNDIVNRFKVEIEGGQKTEQQKRLLAQINNNFSRLEELALNLEGELTEMSLLKEGIEVSPDLYISFGGENGLDQTALRLVTAEDISSFLSYTRNTNLQHISTLKNNLSKHTAELINTIPGDGNLKAQLKSELDAAKKNQHEITTVPRAADLNPTLLSLQYKFKEIEEHHHDQAKQDQAASPVAAQAADNASAIVQLTSDQLNQDPSEQPSDTYDIINMLYDAAQRAPGNTTSVPPWVSAAAGHGMPSSQQHEGGPT